MVEWIIARAGSPTPRLTASALLREFGSLAAILAADPRRVLRATGGDAAAADEIAALKRVMRHALHERVAARPVIGNWRALLDHLRSAIGFGATEEFRVLHLDAHNGLICEDVAAGSVDRAPVHVREVVRRALDIGTASLILAHNHPSGDPEPSSADIALTRQLVTATQVFGIAVHDHLILAAGAHVSMRQQGLLR